MDESFAKVRASLKQDPAAAILFGIALVLVVLTFTAAFSRNVALIEVAMVLTGAFALVGAGFGLARGLRSSRATRRPRA